ncbi:MAG: retropepsin-like aspartic protease [Luteolibacter sp.]
MTLPFKVSRTGHQVVEAWFRESRMKLVIDSAAGANVIDIESAARLGIKTIGERKHTRGLGTSSHKTVSLKSFTVLMGDITVSLKAIGLDLNHVKSAGGKGGLDGLIGAPFLIAHEAILDFNSKTLTFNSHPLPKKSAAGKSPTLGSKAAAVKKAAKKAAKKK